ncbi:MAG: hypothetical protein WCE62_17205 [Polyangiales bacterium]
MSSAISEAPRAALAADFPRVRFGSAYIVSPLYDWFWFLLPPVLALGLGFAIHGLSINHDEFVFWNQDVTATGLFLGILIHAHIVIVLFRSHGNPQIYKLHPGRFIAVPILLYVLMNASMWILVSVSVLATFWDVYHSGMQTFGFARIYDRKIGNDALVGRRLDWALNQLLYAGPIFAGATMMDHVEDFEEYEAVGSAFFPSIPGFMAAHRPYLSWPILVGGTLFLAYYGLSQWRMHQAGRQVSVQKTYLLVSTGLVSIYTWGFNTWGEAFFIMNVFHAVQYFGLVWATEKSNIVRICRLDGRRFAIPIALGVLVGTGIVYGYFVEAVNPDVNQLWSLVLVMSIMHFWYDGFIWSVQKKQV